MSNRYAAHSVKISAGYDKGKTLHFEQCSDDRYSVTGFETARSSIWIERRRPYTTECLMYDSGDMLQLADSTEWLVHMIRSNSYYGVLATGKTAQEAYTKYCATRPQ